MEQQAGCQQSQWWSGRSVLLSGRFGESGRCAVVPCPCSTLGPCVGPPLQGRACTLTRLLPQLGAHVLQPTPGTISCMYRPLSKWYCSKGGRGGEEGSQQQQEGPRQQQRCGTRDNAGRDVEEWVVRHNPSSAPQGPIPIPQRGCSSPSASAFAHCTFCSSPPSLSPPPPAVLRCWW